MILVEEMVMRFRRYVSLVSYATLMDLALR